ncbi:hypothetical protein ACP4OV_026835 [Aristida adscensionis]
MRPGEGLSAPRTAARLRRVVRGRGERGDHEDGGGCGNPVLRHAPASPEHPTEPDGDEDTAECVLGEEDCHIGESGW